MERLEGHNAEKLLEWSVGIRIIWAVVVNFKFVYSSGSKEVLNNVYAQVTNHGRIVIRVVPTPVRCTSIIVVKYPLGAFKILL